MTWCLRGVAWLFIFLFPLAHASDECVALLRLNAASELLIEKNLGENPKRVSPRKAKQLYQAIASREIFERIPNPAPGSKVEKLSAGDLLPQHVVNTLRNRIDYLLRLGLAAEDNYGRRSQKNAADFHNWLVHEENEIFNADKAVEWAESKITYDDLLDKITAAYDWETKNASLSWLDHIRHHTHNPHLRSLLRKGQGTGRFLGAFTLGAITAGIGMAFTGYIMTYTGVDTINRYQQAESYYQVAHSQTSIIVDLMRAKNSMHHEARIEFIRDSQEKAKKIADETSRVLNEFQGLSGEAAVNASKKLEDYYSEHRFLTDRYLSKNLSDGRSTFAWYQLTAPVEWIQRINSAYTPFSLKKDKIENLRRELMYAEEKLKNPEKFGLSIEFLQKDIQELNSKIAMAQKEVEFYRDQAATILALWKINELVYAELFVKSADHMGRGEFYQKIVQEIGYEFYYSNLKDKFLKSAESLGFFFDQGEIEGQFKDDIEILFTEAPAK